jgi:endo-1,4-beta-xylanase
VHPDPDRYNFDPADRYVAFGEANGMAIIGHTLVWHNQTPPWVFRNDKGELVDRDTLLKRMREHIHAVVGRYKGRIKGWDVVNEAVYPDGTIRATNHWYHIIGEDFIAKAFQFAHEADPQAELYYNDFALEDKPKRDGVIAIIRKLQAQKIPIHAVGSQMHARLDWPTVEAVEQHLEEMGRLGLKVMITELDIDVLPEARQYRGTNLTQNPGLNAALNIHPNGLPYAIRAGQAKRYQDFFRLYQKYADKIERVTFWGVTDADSWLNYWPVSPRVNYPLLFDREGNPKLAFEAVMKTAGPESARR